MNGLLGSLLGESSAAQKARIEEATKSANDLTSMIRHKKGADANGSAKRKSEADDGSSHSKRAKTEEAPET